MNNIDEILSNIKSIGFFLANRKDIESNFKLHEKIKKEGKELTSDIIDLKLYDLQYNLNALNKYFTQMKKDIIQKIKICIASSQSLKEEREKIETFLFRKNDDLVENGIYLYYNVWEKQSLRFNHTYKQEDFNKSLVYDSEIFICLIDENVGKFTKEEFDEAKKRFDANEKPYVFYVYFKEFEGKGDSFYKTDGWLKRVALEKHINDEFKQYAGIFKNKDDLIRSIENNLLEDIKIIKEKKIIPSTQSPLSQ